MFFEFSIIKGNSHIYDEIKLGKGCRDSQNKNQL